MKRKRPEVDERRRPPVELNLVEDGPQRGGARKGCALWPGALLALAGRGPFNPRRRKPPS